jgi:hypothetical protein
MINRDRRHVLEIVEEGSYLMIDGRYQFDLREEKKYIVVTEEGVAEEL